LQLGQADGIACRTMEMFEAFDLSERVLKEACRINEVTFWKPDEKEPGRIVRHGRVQDAFNLGWKLAAVLRGHGAPELLHTYSAERRVVAQELIDFDREWATMFSDRPRQGARGETAGVAPKAFQKHFEQQGRFTAGMGTHCRFGHLRRSHAPAAGRRIRDRNTFPFRAGAAHDRRQAGPPGTCRQGRRPLAPVRLCRHA
jgi:hypothetical protein